MERIERNTVRILSFLLSVVILALSVHAQECDHEYVRKEESATCTKAGVQYYECNLCGDQYGFVNTDPLGHLYSSWKTTVEPGCETAGQEQRDCERCGNEEIREIAAAGHSYHTQLVEPDCENQGYTLYSCSVCGDEYKTDYTDPAGHRFSEKVVAPTCTKEGYTLKTCSVCGDEEKTDYTDAAGHSYESEIVLPTCTKDGYTLKTCTVCGDEEKSDYTDSTGHHYESEVIAPTCTKGGYTLRTCAACGDSEKTDATKKTGHHYDEGVVTKKPTTTAMGRITYTCHGCGDTYTETTPKLVNPFVDVKKSAYYFDAVIWAVDRGITSGIDETHFAPDAACTRAQVVTFLWRSAGSPEPTGESCPFVDVPEGSYYRKAVIWAAERGITSGMDATHFGSDRPCTRAQVVSFLYRAAGRPEWDGADRFTDVDREDYFFLSVSWAADNGITSGVDGGRFAPHQSCTRAQIVTFLYRSEKAD